MQSSRLIVDNQMCGQVDGVGTHEISIAFGYPETVDMGIESVDATDVMHSVRDVLANVTIVAIAVCGGEEVGRKLLPVKIHFVGVCRIDNDVDVVYCNVDVRMVESTESHFIDTLFDRGNPNH